jgi:hypothetical protein
MRDRNALLKLVQKTIDDGATSAEEIHRRIARMPLKVLAELGVLRKPVKEVDRVQDLAIGKLYDLIRDINEQVATFAARLLARAETGKGRKAAATKRKPASRTTASGRAAAPRKRATAASKKPARRA